MAALRIEAADGQLEIPDIGFNEPVIRPEIVKVMREQYLRWGFSVRGLTNGELYQVLEVVDPHFMAPQIIMHYLKEAVGHVRKIVMTTPDFIKNHPTILRHPA